VRDQHGIALPYQIAEKGLRALRKLGLVDSTLRYRRTETTLLVPLMRPPLEEEAKVLEREIGIVELQRVSFAEEQHKPRTLSAALQGKIPIEIETQLPRAFDVIGDIALLDIPPSIEQFAEAIGHAIMEINLKIRLVLGKYGQTEGQFRLRQYKTIAGSGGTETFHQEFSCRYHLDVSKVYFNPRLSNERLRVAKQLSAGETVVDMFAGVGPYSVLIGKRQPASRVYSVDLNPSAYSYLNENVFINRVADQVIPILGDAKKLGQTRLRNTADRVIMNLPGEAFSFVPSALHILKETGGVMHFYAFTKRGEDPQVVGQMLMSKIREEHRAVESLDFCEVIREVAPNRVQVAIDAVIK
jgi:tRNA (guanine37-N1)-methyltransferase